MWLPVDLNLMTLVQLFKRRVKKILIVFIRYVELLEKTITL